MNLWTTVLGFLIIILPWISLSGQSLEEYKQRAKTLQKEISELKEQRGRISGELTSQLEKVSLLERELSVQKQLHKSLLEEKKFIVNKRNILRDSLLVLEEKINSLNKAYAAILKKKYLAEIQLSTPILLILTEGARSLLTEYTVLERAAQTAAVLKKRIENKREQMKKLLREQEKLMERQVTLIQENKILIKEIEGSTDLVGEQVQMLKKSKGLLQSQLSEKDEQRKVIASLIKKATEKAPVRSEDYASVSRVFEQNKGALPWPVKEGKIVRGFGTISHPELPGIKIRNTGLDIWSPTQEVRAVAEGEVLDIRSLSGQGRIITIQHGNYFTVHSGLSEELVDAGEKVAAGTVIGYTGDDGKVHFEIWHQTAVQDPRRWLRK